MSAAPLTAAEFAELMATCGPFENSPHLAVAVSGGPDSLALTLLAADWAKTQGGHVTGLTVDHKLRPNSGDEARRVGAWLGARDIDHVTLEWRAARPAGNLMAAARAARYDLLNDWCRRHNALHFLLAHHLEDQAATVLQRLRRGSGLDGLAAMASKTEDFPRRLRPLLSVPRTRLSAYLESRGQGWIDDPTNRDPAFERPRIDAFLGDDNPLDLKAERLALAATNLNRAKASVERDVAAALAKSTSLSPLGMAEIDIASLRAETEEVRLRVLARILLTVGGQAYPPRLARLDRLHRAILDNRLEKVRTLAGCRLRSAAGRVTILRERAAIAPPAPVTATDLRWDNRFRVRSPETLCGDTVWIGRMTQDHWRRLKALAPETAKAPIPAALRWTLPVLGEGEQLLAAPHFGYIHDRAAGMRIAFAPRHALT